MATCNPKAEAHRDGVLLVEYLMDRQGSASAPQDEIAWHLGMTVERQGLRDIDRRRFHRARRHVHERCDSNGRPCCGFRLHYRTSSRNGSTLALIDPSGDLGSHARAVLASVAGYITRKRQHTTEDTNMVETFRAVADHAMSRGDLDGARLMLTASIDIERSGSIAPETMGNVEAWLAL